jgi:Uma2 family endonuclease
VGNFLQRINLTKNPCIQDLQSKTGWKKSKETVALKTELKRGFFLSLLLKKLMETAQILAGKPIDTSTDSETTSDYERERGKPMPSKLHAAIQGNLMDALSPYKQDFKRLPELSLRLQGEKFVPDISLYPIGASDWSVQELEMTLAPLVTIEIVSPAQSIDDMKRKADKYLAAGVKSVWLVLPALGGIMALHTGKKARFFSEEELVDDVVGIRIPLDEVFE